MTLPGPRQSDPANVAGIDAIDGLELELRRLPGVASVGFSGRDRDLTLHLAVPSGADRASVRSEAEELARAHLDHPISVTIDFLGEVARPPSAYGRPVITGADRALRSVSNDWATSAAAVVADDEVSDLQPVEVIERRRADEVTRGEVQRPNAATVAGSPAASSAPETMARETVAPETVAREAVAPEAVEPLPAEPVPGEAAAGPESEVRAPEPVLAAVIADPAVRPGSEEVRRRTRVALLGVEVVDGGKNVEVHLGHGSHRTVGRGRANRTATTATATLHAIEQLGWAVPFTVRSAVRLGLGVEGAVAVVLDGPGGDRMGLGRADSADLAAVKATLHAINRYLEDTRPTGTAGP